MNLEKFTERSRGFIQAAQAIAQREDHARLGASCPCLRPYFEEMSLISSAFQVWPLSWLTVIPK